ncbi:bifunctional hydroxymethylpyrimidine kinase/phosphomethylpyrimidine kinase [Tistrella bauzanensis]
MTGASRAPMRRLLSVDHGDPEGRGGIAFDLKLATACGVYAASAVTAIVADGAAMTVPADIVGGQLRVVLDDIGADALRSAGRPKPISCWRFLRPWSISAAMCR